MSKRTNIKTTLLNIDSAYRTTLPKNICQSNCIYLPNNPLTFTKGSNIINIYYPDHKLITGDNITIQNVEGYTKIINSSLYLLTDFKYLMIVVDSNDIDIDYKNYTPELYCNIDIVGEQTENNLIGNITFNTLIGVKKLLLINDIAKSHFATIEPIIQSIVNSTEQSIIEQKCLFIELPIEFNSINNEYIQINQIFKISYLHIGGIKLGYLNANFPINNYNYQSNFEVYDIIDTNNFLIKVNNKSYGNIIFGGNKIIVMKILDTLIGYPDADEYVINLKRSFTNITNIELVSTEFPYVDIVIKKNVNDKLYWKNIEDGNNIYNIIIDEGFYSSDTFIKQLQVKMNLVKRINYTVFNKLFNYFDIILENNLHKITFKPYNLSYLPNSLSIREEYINTESYFIGKTLRWLKKNTNFKIVISYADTFHNHQGTIYKASNFEYHGLTAKGRVIEHGNKFYHDKCIRTYYVDKNGNKNLKPFAQRVKDALESGDAKYIDTPGKHIFTYRLIK
jgi:hypothetical protein